MFHRIALIILTLPATVAQAQPGGRVAIPNITQAQAAALVRISQELQPLTQAVVAARTALVAASMAGADEASLRAKADAIRAAELLLANARAEAFLKLQSSPNKLSAPQITAYEGMSIVGGGGRGGRVPDLSAEQSAYLREMDKQFRFQIPDLAVARSTLVQVTLEPKRNDALIRAKADAIGAAELALAKARVVEFGRLQASPLKLRPDQLEALAAMGGSLPAPGTGGLNFTEPQPLDFSEHEGFVSLFDGKTLKDWDGNPKFWRVEDGAIVGESTPQNPSGNTYLVYRGVMAHDFTLKFEIKVEGDGGSGVQYRSQTGLSWQAPVALNVIANSGPTNLDWMMTGPQADFWPSRDFTGQFYSENTPMRIMAWRGQVVEGAGTSPRRLMGNIGDRRALNDLVRKNDWNQYTVIARGGTFIHIVNGQLMAVMVDDDLKDLNNQSGLIGIEIEATTKVSVKNIWLKKLN
jgi:hypothetical protein